MACPPLVPGGSQYGIPMFPQGDLVVAVYLAGTSGDRLEMGKVPRPRGCSNYIFGFLLGRSLLRLLVITPGLLIKLLLNTIIIKAIY